MTKTAQHIFLLLAFACLPFHVGAQEMIVPPAGNPVLSSVSRFPSGSLLKSTGNDTVDLPLLEDFSTSRILPDPALWSDDYAYVNNSFPIRPPSIGVATLDALDPTGSVYNSAGSNYQSQPADTLTSHAIRLKSELSDNVYLSFFYQPAGLGDEPEESDSLLLDFFSPADTSWTNVWGIPGSELHDFSQVMLPITDAHFLMDGFRFRFRNLISLPDNDHYPDKMANVDLWHIDYIRLGRNRSAADTVMRDVAFVSSMMSILKDVSAIPWSHFEDAFHNILDQTIPVRYQNNDTISRNVSRSLVIEQPLWGESYTPVPATAQDLAAGEDTVVEYSFIYPTDVKFDRGDSNIYRFKAALRTDEFDFKGNDTVYHDQLFSDFYAYDDGSHEAGYGLRGGGSANGMVALKYHTYTPDRIGGVDICFNRLKDSVNLGYYFSLMVWEEGADKPGSLLLEDGEDRLPFYASTYPGFVRYYFSEPVDVDGTFYVGWKQFNEYNINFGLDLNSIPQKQAIYYNLGTGWLASAAPGALMIRPFLYDESLGNRSDIESIAELSLYPNPASSRVYIEFPNASPTGEILCELYDPSGRLIHKDVLTDMQLEVGMLEEGLYYLRVNDAQSSHTAKLLIRR